MLNTTINAAQAHGYPTKANLNNSALHAPQKPNKITRAQGLSKNASHRVGAINEKAYPLLTAI